MEHWQNLSLDDIEGEVWKDIPGYGGLYEASTKGRIKSLEKPFFGKTKKTRNRGTAPTKILKQDLGKRKGQQYLKLELNNLGKAVRKGVHRWVALTFIPNPENKPQVNHKNGIRTDNTVENLEWNTCFENIQHSVHTGLKNVSFGTRHYATTLNIETINEIFDLRKLGMSYSQIGNKVNTTGGNVHLIITRQNWKHIRQNEEGRWYEPE